MISKKQYDDLQKHGGYYPLSVKLYEVHGDTACSFLHGQLTNNIKALKSSEGNYNLLLTNKGKIVADTFVYFSGEKYFLLIDKECEQKALSHFNKYSTLSQIQLIDKSTAYAFYHLLSGQNLFPQIPSFRTDRLGQCGIDLWIKKEDEKKYLQEFSETKLVYVDEELKEILRVEGGRTKKGQDYDENNLPQEVRLDHALHFEKGCYLGQETIARLHFRGHVNKIIVGLKLEGEKVLAVPSDIFDGNNLVGKITSCVYSLKLATPLALGFVPYVKSQAGNTFLVGPEKIRAIIVALPVL